MRFYFDKILVLSPGTLYCKNPYTDPIHDSLIYYNRNNTLSGNGRNLLRKPIRPCCTYNISFSENVSLGVHNPSIYHLYIVWGTKIDRIHKLDKGR
jgi:hypothetical protein